MIVAVFIFALAIPLAFFGGYWMGHYEALRCSCKPQTQHVLRRLFEMPLTEREANEMRQVRR